MLHLLGSPSQARDAESFRLEGETCHSKHSKDRNWLKEKRERETSATPPPYIYVQEKLEMPRP